MFIDSVISRNFYLANEILAMILLGAWPDFFDHSGRAPIHYAIMRNNLEMVSFISM